MIALWLRITTNLPAQCRGWRKASATTSSIGGEPARDGDPGEAAHYLRDAITELSQIAHRHGLETLAYLLDMAQMEADELVRLRGGPNGSSR